MQQLEHARLLLKNAVIATTVLCSGLLPAHASAQTVETDKVCRAYADSAVDDQTENLRLGCGLAGGRFSDDWSAHYGWCITAPHTAVETERRLRREALATCHNRTAAPTRPFLNFSAQRVEANEQTDDTSVQVAQIPSFVLHAASHGVDAAMSTENGIYLFQGDTYLRYALGNGNLDLRRAIPALNLGYPRLLPGELSGLPQQFHQDLDAALFEPKTKKIYFFKGREYVRLTGSRTDAGYPRPLPGGWQGLPESFWPIDAALAHGGKTYLFSGDQYTRFTDFKLDRGYPRNLPGGWDLPANFRPGIGAAFDTNQGTRAVMFSGSDIAQLSKTRLDPSFPRPIGDLWRGLPQLITAAPKGRLELTLESTFEPNLQLSSCVRVTGYRIPTGGFEDMLFGLRFYPWTGTYCPGDWPQSPCSGIQCIGNTLIDSLETVASVWDGFLELVDDLKGELLELASQYHPFCLQAGLVSSDAASVCEDLVKAGGSIAIDAYLLANGIPPTLPTSSQLLEMGKGNLEEIAMELLDSAGVPCDDLNLSPGEASLGKDGAAAAGLDVSNIDTSNGFDVCREIVRASINELQTQTRNALSARTAKSTGLPYFPYVVIVPEPRAQVQPLHVRVKLDGTAQPCEATIRVSGLPQGTQGSRGAPVEPYRAKTITLTPGRWTSVVLDEPSPLQFNLDGEWRRARQAQDRVAPNDYSNVLIAGNRLTAEVSPNDGSCFELASIASTVSMASSRPSGFPARGETPAGFSAWKREQCRGLPNQPPQSLSDTAGNNAYQRWVSLQCGIP